MDSAEHHLVLNTAIVRVQRDATIEAGLVPYEDEAQLARVREELRGTHLVLRAGRNLRTVPVSEGANPVGNRIKIRLANEPAILCALVRERLLSIFSETYDETGRRELTGHRPVKVISGRGADELVSVVLRDGDRDRIPPWLARRVRYEFDARYFRQNDGEDRILLSFGIRTRNRIDATCTTLLSHGVSIKNRYVEVARDGGDPRLEPRRLLVGRVEQITGDVLKLTDARDGWFEVNSNDAYLEPRDEHLEDCLVALLGKGGKNATQRLRAASGYVTSGPTRLKRAEVLLNFLRKHPLTAAPGVNVDVGDLLHSGLDEFTKWEVMPEPTLSFHPSGRNATTVPYKGLDEFGPYDRAIFSPKQPRIAIICHHQHATERFVESFLNGLEGDNVFSMGFVARFRLGQPKVEVFRATGRSAADYETACRKALVRSAEADWQWDLALVQIEDDFKLLPTAHNPYFVTKAFLYRHQIPAQEFTLRTIQQKGFSRGMSLSNISLACYAKLGGTPWVLQASPTASQELIFGLRSYKPLDSRFDKNSRFVGLTTVFKGDGMYLFEGRTRAVPFENYSSEMLATLHQAVAAVRREQNWDRCGHIRLIFHVFKPLKNSEIDAVQALVDELRLPNAEFAFVQMVQSHPYTLMDTNQKGITLRSNHRKKKGVLAPPRGLLVQMGTHDALVVFKGPQAVKREDHGLPRPILMRLHPRSTFTDMAYLARQAFALSAHSWRTFEKAGVPVTVSYSGYIAEKLSRLQDVPGWSNDTMLGRISKTRWFL